MAGIYIHIPFCRQACHYCDFHFSVSLKGKKDFLSALKKEIKLQKNYLAGKQVETIYFGGGTPSILSKEELLDIFADLQNNFSIAQDAEITLEANPDDLSKEKLKELSETPVNRLSIGIQSFSNDDLRFMNRIHDTKTAIASVKNAQRAGFRNITIDLIYGIQTLTNKQWKKNLEQAFQFSVQHISCYSLTVEPKTPLASFIKKGKIQNISSEKSASQFEILMDEMEENKFIHYEISNFCKKGFHSRHNSNYWKGVHYLGLGSSAHSYNGDSRQWNISGNAKYISSLAKNILPFQKEILTENQKYNEYIMTSLRTIEGTGFGYVKQNFGEKYYGYLQNEAGRYIESGQIKTLSNGEGLILSRSGKIFADKIASDLFI